MDGRIVSLAIAQIGTADEGGGAATVARGLMRGYAARGHRVWHIVGRKRSDDPNVVMLPDDDRLVCRWTGYAALQNGLRRLAGRFPDRGLGRASRTLRLVTHPRVVLSRLKGAEDFDFPGTAGLLDRLGGTPDIVHGHNLQGGFFDLRALATISARVPTMLTLHDMWLLTGHCAHSLGCHRWQTGCGSCPDLTLDPPVRRDATAGNWRRKQDVFAKSRLSIVTPSRWLRDQVEASMLGPWARTVRVIPNGVDTTVFRPANRAAIREALGLPRESFIVLLTTGSRGSMWKDDRVLKDAMARLVERPLPRPIEFVAVGRASAVAGHGRAVTRSIPFQHDARQMAKYYQAADVYMHAARADTCPLAVLEAMACGTPVVATAVGGIPEQIQPAGSDAIRASSDGAIGGATGVLVPARRGAEMADAVERLLSCDEARRQMGANAVQSVIAHFTLDHQVEAYLAFYRQMLETSTANNGRDRE